MNNTDDGLREDNEIELIQGLSAPKAQSNKARKESSEYHDDGLFHIEGDEEDR